MADQVKNLLAEVQLESFFVKLRDHLQITRIEHFESVKANDLLKIGMSKPAIRRLKKALSERRVSAKPGFQKFLAVEEKRPTSAQDLTRQSLACLIVESDLELGEKLGDGSFGVVKKALWRKTGQQVAVKVLKRDLISNDQVLEDFIREVNVMHNLSHRHLVKLHGVCLGPQPMMITELAIYGSLLDYLHENHAKILLSTLHLYSFQLANALAYLESKSFIHRDIALRNIFLLTPEHLKLGDFGLARVLTPQNSVYIMAPDRKVPYAWCAPESLKYRQFTHAADAWMFAVTLYELYTFGGEPWMGMNGAEILKAIDQDNRRLDRPEGCPTVIYQMMLQCWLPDPDDRPTFAAIYTFLSENHPTEMRCKDRFYDQSDKKKLSLERDDMVLIVDGRSDKRWWYGQNKRTFAFGYFPRPVLDPLRPLAAADISKPLPNTFVHLGSSDGGVDNVAIIPEQIYVEAPMTTGHRNLQEDNAPLNPTYLPCRKAPNGQTEVRPVTQFHHQQNGSIRSEPQARTRSELIPASQNPFVTDVFMPELFADTFAAQPNGSQKIPSRSQTPTVLATQPISAPQREAPKVPTHHTSSASLLDRSTAHYSYLPQPLMPSPDKRSSEPTRPLENSALDPFFVDPVVREVLAGSRKTELTPEVLPESRSRRSAPVDGQLPFQPVYQQTQMQPQPLLQPSSVPLSSHQPSIVLPGYSPAGDLAASLRPLQPQPVINSGTPFVALHSQLSNLFNNPSQQIQPQNVQLTASPTPVTSQRLSTAPNNAALFSQPMFVRLPPPDSHPKLVNSNGSSRKVTPLSNNSTPPCVETNSRSSPSVSQQAIANHSPPKFAPPATQIQIHRPAMEPAAPLLPGNYRTAKFLEMASLSPSRQQTSQGANSGSTASTARTSKYTRSEDVLQQLRGTLEIAQQRRLQAEKDAEKIVVSAQLAAEHAHKVRQLVVLGLAPDEVCHQLLVKHNWNVEAAGSELAEKACRR